MVKTLHQCYMQLLFLASEIGNFFSLGKNSVIHCNCTCTCTYTMTVAPSIPLVGVKTMALRGLCMRRRSATTASCLEGETSIACSKEQRIQYTLNLHPMDSYKQLGWKSSMSKIYICIHNMCTHMYIQYNYRLKHTHKWQLHGVNWGIIRLPYNLL